MRLAQSVPADGVHWLKCRTRQAFGRKFGTDEKFTTPIGNGLSIAAFNSETCETFTQPAIAIRGRAHSLVDAIGFICDEP
jgi:hypothetical protein